MQNDKQEQGKSGVRARRTIAIGVFALCVSISVTAPFESGPSVSRVDAAAAARGYDRIVALSAFSANALALMGTFPKAIGQPFGGNGDDRFVSGLRLTPRLELRHPYGPNLEVLQRKRPDLIFTSPQWSDGLKPMQDVVRKRRGKVVNAEPTFVDDVVPSIRKIAKVVGAKTYRRERLARSTRTAIAKAVRGVNYFSRNKPRVMVILGVGISPRAFTKNSWAGDIVQRAGGELRPGYGSKRTTPLAKETVFSENPDVIIVVPHGNPGELDDEAKNRFRDEFPGVTSRFRFSEDSSLLQAGTDVGRTIRIVRRFIGT